ncbi:MAG TPA: TetR family transcriptional regulator [Ktedonobacterales bacterium]|nr:TetR family transcriptional regulator [Ktedonobacterales bacterium]
MARKTAEATEETRQALLRAGLLVFSQQGYAATRLEDVAQAAGVTRGAIYWHFKSKADLYAALVDEASARLEQVIASARGDGGSFLAIMRRVMVRMLAYLAEDEMYRATQGLLLLKTGFAADLRNTYQRQLGEIRAKEEELAAIMRAGVVVGEFRADLDPVEGARAMLAYLDGVTFHWLLSPDTFSIVASAPALVDIYIRGIAARSE